MIPFNKPFFTGNELKYIEQAVGSGKISGNGVFTKKCHDFFEKKYSIKKALLTSSCTDALEMCSMLAGISHGDEVIVPSYTFVSTALAFVRSGARIVFADSRDDHPGINEKKVEELITSKTKAIVVVHYAGVACDMDKVMDIAQKYHLIVIEDAAHAIESHYNGKPLGTIGDLAAFSFHETKNIIAGEGGLLAINNSDYIERSEILWEKGTNRASFARGEINKYGWVDTGSSFLPSEITSAFLYSQLESIDIIQQKRIQLWKTYYNNLSELGDAQKLLLPHIPDYATNNAHMFYIICKNLEEREKLREYLIRNGVHAVFHYLPLHESKFAESHFEKQDLPNSTRYSDTLLRLPIYFELDFDEVEKISKLIKKFFAN